MLSGYRLPGKSRKRRKGYCIFGAYGVALITGEAVIAGIDRFFVNDIDAITDTDRRTTVASDTFVRIDRDGRFHGYVVR